MQEPASFSDDKCLKSQILRSDILITTIPNFPLSFYVSCATPEIRLQILPSNV